MIGNNSVLQNSLQVPEPTAFMSISSLDRNLTELENVLQILFDRLKGVRNEKPTKTPCDKKSEEKSSSPITLRLDGISNRVFGIRLATENILGELEV